MAAPTLDEYPHFSSRCTTFASTTPPMFALLSKATVLEAVRWASLPGPHPYQLMLSKFLILSFLI